MGRNGPLPTQRNVPAGIPAELSAAGYEDPEEIGRGGFGMVYRCTQRALGRTVAVKVLTTDLEPDNLERFMREQIAMVRRKVRPSPLSYFSVTGWPGVRLPVVSCCQSVFWSGILTEVPLAATQPNSA